MEMRLTKENVLMIEHKILNDTCIWDLGNAEQERQVLFYIEGVRTMAEEVMKAIEELKKL